MADERTIETLDAYLRNKLDGQERAAFEQQLNADPALKQEYLFQKGLVDGIREVRRIQLKTALNNIPVPTGGWGSTLTVKGVTWLVVAGVTGGLIYYGLTRSKQETPGASAPTEQVQPAEANPDKSELQPEVNQEKSPVQDKSQVEENPAREDKPSQESQATSKKTTVAAKQAQPNIQVFDPTDELDSDKEEAPVVTSQEKSTAVEKALTPSFDVETNSDNKKYDFDYQFDNGKLILYGSFEKNLYEILEFFNGNKHTAFLYYKQNYYLLDEQNTKVSPLTPITDPALLNKLKQSREK